MRHWFRRLRKSTLNMVNPRSQSRFKCCSTRRVMSFTHSGSGTAGASSPRRCRGTEDHSGMSGIPVQNLKRNANATPKYHGTNCFSMRLPLATMKRCMCASLATCRLRKRCRALSASAVLSPPVMHQWPADVEVHRHRRSDRASMKPAESSRIDWAANLYMSPATSVPCSAARAASPDAASWSSFVTRARRDASRRSWISPSSTPERSITTAFGLSSRTLASASFALCYMASTGVAGFWTRSLSYALSFGRRVMSSGGMPSTGSFFAFSSTLAASM